MGRKKRGCYRILSVLLALLLTFSAVELPVYATEVSVGTGDAGVADEQQPVAPDKAMPASEVQPVAPDRVGVADGQQADPEKAEEETSRKTHTVYAYDSELDLMKSSLEGDDVHAYWSEFDYIGRYEIEIDIVSTLISWGDWAPNPAPHHYNVYLYLGGTCSGEPLATWRVEKPVCDMEYAYEPQTTYSFWAQLCNEDESIKSRMPSGKKPSFTTPNARKITYELNGGTNNPNNPGYATVPEDGGMSMQLLFAPSRQGFFFEGWYLDAAFTKKVEKNILNVTGDVTVYAKWSTNFPEDAYWSIYFDGNGSDSGSMSKQRVSFSQKTVKLNKNAFKKTGYVFACWNTKANGSGTSYDDEATIGHLTSGNNETVALYAIWMEAGKGIIHYELNGGTNNPANPSYFTSTVTEFELKDPTKEGHVFEGWYTDPAFAEATKVTRLNKDQHGGITVYAKWRPCNYNVVYNKNNDSAEGSMVSTQMTYGGTGKLAANTYTRADYIFCGWTLAADGQGEAFPDQADQAALESSLTSIEDGMTVTLYAVWGKAGTYTVTYELNGGTNHPDNPGTFEAGSSFQLREPTREGYTFGGWFKDAAFTKEVKTFAGIAENITIYAKWEGTGNPPAPEDKDDGLYDQSERKTFSTIEAKIGKIKDKVYDGNDYMPTVKVTATVDGRNVVLTEVADYRVIYENNVNAGTGKVIVRGNGAYSGEISETFTISKRPVGKLKVIVGNMGLNAQEEPPIYVYDGTRLLTKGEDYTLSGTQGMTSSAGKKTVMLAATEKGNYVGERKVSVTVSPTDKILQEADVSLGYASTAYTGKAQRPSVTVRYAGAELDTKSYAVKFINNKDTGTAYVLVTGKKEYAGSVLKSFQITTTTKEFQLKKMPVDTTFTGKVQKPKVTVTVDGKTLKAGKDYVVFYRNNFHATVVSGQAEVLVMGRGSYKEIPTGTFKYTIQSRNIAKVTVKGTQEQMTVTYAGRTLKEGKDFKVTKREEVAGKLEVTIEGLGDFEGSVIKKIKIA